MLQRKQTGGLTRSIHRRTGGPGMCGMQLQVGLGICGLLKVYSHLNNSRDIRPPELVSNRAFILAWILQYCGTRSNGMFKVRSHFKLQPIVSSLLLSNGNR